MSKARGLADLGNAYSDGALSNRNLIINGAMQVAQRGTSSTSSAYQTVDRIKLATSASELAFTQSQASEGPSGFSKSWKFTVTTPETTLDASDVVYLKYAVEDYDLQGLGFGTSDAKTITLSFWVRSSVTGDYAFTLYQADGNKGYNTVYTVNSANTWEYKTITISGNTADVINADSGIGFDLYFVLSSGSTYRSNSSMRDTWAAYISAGFAYGQTAEVMTTSAATWQITGVQLEVGDTATPFEHRSYGDELARCQRYYQRYVTDGYAYGRFSICENRATNKSQAMFDLGQAMRAVPTLQTTGTASNYALYNSEAIIAATALTYDSNPTARVTTIQVSVASGLVDGGASQLMANNNASSYIAFDAEL